MNFNRKVLSVALAAALPWIGAYAQSNAELLKQIEALKAQLEGKTNQLAVYDINSSRSKRSRPSWRP